jgi:acetone carboxylase gamma subunit
VTERVSVRHVHVQVTCECGHVFNESNRATHLISNIHRNNMSALRRHQ